MSVWLRECIEVNQTLSQNSNLNFETEVRNPFKPAENSAIEFNCTNKKKNIIITYYLFTFITPFPPVYSQTIKSGTNANAE